MMNKQTNDLPNFMRSLDKDKLIHIYLNNNVCILTEPKHLQFFDDYLIYSGKSQNGTIFYPHQENIYPNVVSHLNVVPYSAISLITG